MDWPGASRRAPTRAPGLAEGVLAPPESVDGDWPEGRADYLKEARGPNTHFSRRTEAAGAALGNATPLTTEDSGAGSAPAVASASVRQGDGQGFCAERGGAGESEPFPQPLPVRDQLRVQ